MAKRTKAELLRIRSETYKPPEWNGERCENCKHCWVLNGRALAICHAIEIHGKLKAMEVHSAGRCDLFEHREPR